MHPSYLQLGEGELNISGKSLLGEGGTGNFYFGGRGGGGGHIILKQKLKLIKSKIKSIFGITNLMYFKDTWKMHLLSSEKISFSMAICPKCLEHLFFQ